MIVVRDRKETMNLPYSIVDPHNPIPLYYQIYLDLRRMIQRGVLQPGSTLPPELEICQAYNVGRQTVRQAIGRLVDDNLVERYAGRGTFIRTIPSIQFFLDRSFSQQMREMGRVPTSKVLRCEPGFITVENQPILEKVRGAPCLTLERLRYGDDELICHQSTIVLTERCPGIESVNFTNQSLFEIITSRYALMIKRMDIVVRAVAADGYRADILEVEECDPLLFVGTATYIEDGELIEYSTSYYRADRYEYSTIQIR